ncbi:MAG TPA: hypothetical protein VFH03_06515 [Actinoplanes sp.]|nr:hypothetical protein [Actinoplanes sp.]
MDDETAGSRYRRLPPRVRPSGTGHDVSTPVPVPEVKYVSPLSPAGRVEAYEQLADHLVTTPRGSVRRIVAVVVLGLGLLALLLYQVR